MSVVDRSSEIEPLLVYLKESRGFDFTGYKRASLERRIRKRMDAVGVDSVERYLDHLQVDPDEFTHLFNFILINVTSFFRDPDIWDFLAAEVLSRILESREGDSLRVWVPGCASGEEPYSVAMIMAERLGIDQVRERVKIYATDVDEDALAQARQGVFTGRQISDVPATFRKKYFEPSGDSFVFKKDLRSAVIFGRHDLVQNAPISKVDLLMCRNTLMYLNADTQAKVLAHFYFALNDWGFLVLGKAEMLFTQARSFTPFDLKRRVFTKAPLQSEARDRMALLSAAGMDPTVGQITNHGRGREAAFELAPISQLVVDRNGILVQANDRARTMFGLNENDLGKDLQHLELSYRPVELRSQVDKVKSERRAIVMKDVRWDQPNGVRFLEVELVPLEDRGGRLMGVSVTFSDVTAFRELQEELEQSNQELETAMEELQSTNEELETTNEELQSTNEELETTNEELQSTNEELETMNEELHSANEELQTINEEVRERGEQVHEVNAFLDSILSSLGTALVVVDRDLRITAWNPRAQELWGLKEGEVRGQAFPSLDIGLPLAPLEEPIRLAFRDDGPIEAVRIDGVNEGGQPAPFLVRFSPMRGSDGHVHGMIVSMEEERSQKSS